MARAGSPLALQALRETRILLGRSRVYRLNALAPISVTLARRDPPAAVVALVGEHDAYSAQRLENELGVLLDDGLHVVVDLRDASFIDSTTLSALLGARHRAESSTLGFALVLPEQDYTQVNRILDLTGLGSTFVIFGRLEEALASVRAGRAAPKPVKAA
jgi:anti-sigma B factor antagonist